MRGDTSLPTLRLKSVSLECAQLLDLLHGPIDLLLADLGLTMNDVRDLRVVTAGCSYPPRNQQTERHSGKHKALAIPRRSLDRAAASNAQLARTFLDRS